MLIWVGEPDYKLITAEEGTGDNLSAQDLKDGYVDYWMTSIWEQDGETLNIIDSGQVLTSKEIKNMEYEEQIARIVEYWGCGDNYSVLEF